MKRSIRTTHAGVAGVTLLGLAGPAVASVASPAGQPNITPAEYRLCQAANRYGDLTSLARFTALTSATVTSLPARFHGPAHTWEQDVVSFGPRATVATLRHDAARVERVCRPVNGY